MATVTAVKPAEKSYLGAAIDAALEEMLKKPTASDFQSYWLGEVAGKPNGLSVQYTVSKDGVVALVGVAAVPSLYPGYSRPGSLDLYPAQVDLDVSSFDIQNGMPGSPSGCAIALAVGRRFDGAICHVGANGITIHRDHSGDVGVNYIDRSGRMNQFICAYDRDLIQSAGSYRASPGGRVSPVTLHLTRV